MNSAALVLMLLAASLMAVALLFDRSAYEGKIYDRARGVSYALYIEIVGTVILLYSFYLIGYLWLGALVVILIAAIFIYESVDQSVPEKMMSAISKRGGR